MSLSQKDVMGSVIDERRVDSYLAPGADPQGTKEIGNRVGQMLGRPAQDVWRDPLMNGETLELIADSLPLIDLAGVIAAAGILSVFARASLWPASAGDFLSDLTFDALCVTTLLQMCWRANARELVSASAILRRTTIFTTLLGLLTSLTSTAGRAADLPFAHWPFLCLAATFGLLLLIRGSIAGVIGWCAHAGLLREVVAIVPGGLATDEVIRGLRQRSVAPIEVIGVFDDRTARRTEGTEVAGTVATLLEFGRKHRIDRIILTFPSLAAVRAYEMAHRLKALSVDIVVQPTVPGWESLSGLADGPFGVLIAARPLRLPARMMKRMEDVLIGSLMLIVAAPVMLAVAILIKLDSKGPVLFKQRREGLNGREISVYKFRSMHVAMTDALGAQQTKRGDPRITRIGNFLRRSSLDELPQLFNVLIGNMSLVGPRPHPIGMRTQDRLCHEIINEYTHRYRMKPGLTGLAQVNGYRGATEVPEQLLNRVRYDLSYIDNWSLWLDIKILYLTVFEVAGMRNAF